MLELKDFMPVNFLKKEKFTGSYRGMRFRMEKAECEGEERLKVTVWPEPYGYDATPQEKKTETVLEFDGEGIAKGVDWVNGQYESREREWKAAGRG